MKKKHIKILDKLWSEKIRSIGYCEYCRSKNALNSHHIISRSNRAIRWLLDNGVCLCPLHHLFSSRMSAHQNPIAFIHWLEKKKGVSFVERLRFKSREIAKGQDFEEIRKELL